MGTFGANGGTWGQWGQFGVLETFGDIGGQWDTVETSGDSGAHGINGDNLGYWGHLGTMGTYGTNGDTGALNHAPSRSPARSLLATPTPHSPAPPARPRSLPALLLCATSGPLDGNRNRKQNWSRNGSGPWRSGEAGPEVCGAEPSAVWGGPEEGRGRGARLGGPEAGRGWD